VRPVDPRAGQVRERDEIGLSREPFGPEPAHLAARCGQAVQPFAADMARHSYFGIAPRITAKNREYAARL
jgi:hypothetical protein